MADEAKTSGQAPVASTSFAVRGDDGVMLHVEITGALAPTPADIRRIAEHMTRFSGLIGVPRG